MKILKSLKDFVLLCDLFQTNEYLRYKGDPQYRTFTGGSCSIILIIIFTAIFASAVLATIRQQSIKWGLDITQSRTDSLSINCTTQDRTQFMFAVGLNNLNMNAGERYFDIKLSQFNSQAGVPTQIQIPLYPCQRQAWQGANAEILEIYDRYNFGQLLCPPKGTQFLLSGFATSLDFQYIKISAVKCNSSIGTLPCASNITLANFLQNNQNFNLNFYFINGLINPSNRQQIVYYLEDRNHVRFNLVYGGSLEIYMKKYSVQTDYSIMPYNDITAISGGVVDFVGHYQASSVFQGVYASVYIRKSHLTLNIKQQFTKMADTLSYIGGLFGFLMIAFFFMRKYTEYSFQIEMGDTLYYYDRDTPLNSSKFHFLSFLLYIIYTILKFFGIGPKIQRMGKFDECRNQIQKQFDISFLMKRIIFFQRSLRILFEDHQFKGLHMHEKMTLKEAQQLRSFYRLRDKIKNKLQKKEDKQIEGIEQQQEGEGQGNNKTQELNMTQNILQNDEYGFEQIIVTDDGVTKSRNFKANSNYQQQNKSHVNSSDIYLNQNSNEIKLPVQLPNKKSNPDKIIKNKFQILRKESESGNPLSKKIFDGVNSELIKKILLKIQENAHLQPNKQSNDNREVVIFQNKNDFQIRISKRSQAEQKQSKDMKTFVHDITKTKIINIRPQKEDSQNKNIQIKEQMQFTLQNQYYEPFRRKDQNIEKLKSLQNIPE